jgi:PhnB protein
MQVNPYLSFEGRCDEALTFYRKVFGAEVEMLMRFKESPDQSMVQPGMENKVMHSTFRIGESRIHASDGRCTGKHNIQGFSLSVEVKNEADARRLFAAVSEGGQVQMPLAKTFFSPAFGMVADRFGVPWMIIVGQ